eukprot:1177865-Prorocentrum_minimum.AAC.1
MSCPTHNTSGAPGLDAAHPKRLDDFFGRGRAEQVLQSAGRTVVDGSALAALLGGVDAAGHLELLVEGVLEEGHRHRRPPPALLRHLQGGPVTGDQSREGRENIPVGGTSRVRGERIYLLAGGAAAVRAPVVHNVDVPAALGRGNALKQPRQLRDLRHQEVLPVGMVRLGLQPVGLPVHRKHRLQGTTAVVGKLAAGQCVPLCTKRLYAANQQNHTKGGREKGPSARYVVNQGGVRQRGWRRTVQWKGSFSSRTITFDTASAATREQLSTCVEQLSTCVEQLRTCVEQISTCVELLITCEATTDWACPPQASRAQPPVPPASCAPVVIAQPIPVSHQLAITSSIGLCGQASPCSNPPNPSRNTIRRSDEHLSLSSSLSCPCPLPIPPPATLLTVLTSAHLDEQVCCAAHLQLIRGDGEVQVIHRQLLHLLDHPFRRRLRLAHRQPLAALVNRHGVSATTAIRASVDVRLKVRSGDAVRALVLGSVPALNGRGRVEQQSVEARPCQGVQEGGKALLPVRLGQVVAVDGGHLLQQHHIPPRVPRGGLRLAVLPADARLAQGLGLALCP